MPNRTTSDERDKLDHATHPTTHATPDDLRAPGGGTATSPKKSGDASALKRDYVDRVKKDGQ